MSIAGLQKSFGRLAVLRDVELEIPEARITAIVGPNGSGKTTLIKTILGLSKPDRGEIKIAGHALDGDWRYRARVGYMPQIPPFPENLCATEVLRMLADLRGLSTPPQPDLVSALDLESELGKPLRQLSGGTRQKVNAVLAFAFNPELLILDEPTAGLDPVASAVMKDRILAERSDGTTFIITSHVMSELEELADLVVFLLEGSVRFVGTVDAILQETGEGRLERAVAALMQQVAQ
ncbi:MAG: ABC transporter ATP-binding protein [Gemmatimonadota bacterium]|nr:MAG: ABC transporter ATP-binding protein [Gemmatimonadota bacterium]